MATVVSARSWEARLVEAARQSALIRIVQRVCQPSDLRHPLDVVVLGSETAWTSPAQIRAIRSRGSRVVGVYPSGDRPGRELLSEADVALPDTTCPESLVRSIAKLQAPIPAPQRARLITVTGPRGAPGRTEVAIAIGRLMARTAGVVLLDLDTEAPSIALKLGLPPSPGANRLAKHLRVSGELVSFDVGDNLSVCGGSLPFSDPGDVKAGVATLIDAALSAFDAVVADIGVSQPNSALTASSDDVILVCKHDPLGLIRARLATREWAGPTPRLVLNQIEPGHDPEEARRAVRRSLGLEPAALVEQAGRSTVTEELLEPLAELAEELSPRNADPRT